MGKLNENRDVLRDFFKRWPKFYYFVAVVLGPLMFCGLSAEKFIKKYRRPGRILNIGSGPKRLGEGIINVDIHPYPGVNVIADASLLPQEDDSVACVISDNVLEHIADPNMAVREMRRVLEPGGIAYISMPFIYPFHNSPGDFQRWTHRGIRELMKEFEIVELGVRAGPFSALTVTLCYLFATIFSFGSEKLYWILLNIFMAVLFPIKLPDVIFNHWPGAINMAAAIYCVARKK